MTFLKTAYFIAIIFIILEENTFAKDSKIEMRF